jgi:hypothetical protein
MHRLLIRAVLVARGTASGRKFEQRRHVSQPGASGSGI